METLVLSSAVEDINYRGTGALHTTFPALVQLSPVNADSLEPQAGENCQTLAERGSEVPHTTNHYYYHTTT
jgi:hypothetical protein